MQPPPAPKQHTQHVLTNLLRSGSLSHMPKHGSPPHMPKLGSSTHLPKKGSLSHLPIHCSLNNLPKFGSLTHLSNFGSLTHPMQGNLMTQEQTYGNLLQAGKATKWKNPQITFEKDNTILTQFRHNLFQAKIASPGKVPNRDQCWLVMMKTHRKPHQQKQMVKTKKKNQEKQRNHHRQHQHQGNEGTN